MQTKESLLLVEGKSEKTLLPVLCRICGVPQTFELRSENSITELKTALKTYLKSSNTHDRIWIIIDADSDSDNAWRSVKDILLRSGKYEFDHKMPLPAEGAVISPVDAEDITVGVWIMPDNSRPGMLEDFLLALIDDKDILAAEAIAAVERLDRERDRYPGLFRRVHRSKACVHTWLAWRDAPGESIPVAAQKSLFLTDREPCVRFMAWLSRLV